MESFVSGYSSSIGGYTYPIESFVSNIVFKVSQLMPEKGISKIDELRDNTLSHNTLSQLRILKNEFTKREINLKLKKNTEWMTILCIVRKFLPLKPSEAIFGFIIDEEGNRSIPKPKLVGLPTGRCRRPLSVCIPAVAGGLEPF